MKIQNTSEEEIELPKQVLYAVAWYGIGFVVHKDKIDPEKFRFSHYKTGVALKGQYDTVEDAVNAGIVRLEEVGADYVRKSVKYFREINDPTKEPNFKLVACKNDKGGKL